MLYSSKAIANYFLELAQAAGQAISPMKLQKLVYYAHGWYAGYTRKPLINEPVEAWQYGPVIPSLYHEFKRFGAGSISGKATDVAGCELREVPSPDDPGIRKFLENIWTSYGQFTGLRLSEMTHAPDGPWARTWEAASGMRGVDISFELIADHFTAAANAAQERSTQA